MNKGVEIILARMESSPEEFRWGSLEKESRQWSWLTNGIREAALVRKCVGHTFPDKLHFLSDEELDALHAKLAEIDGEQFTKDVMHQLLSDKRADAEEGLSGTTSLHSTGTTYRMQQHFAQANQALTHTYRVRDTGVSLVEEVTKPSWWRRLIS